MHAIFTKSERELLFAPHVLNILGVEDRNDKGENSNGWQYKDSK